MQAFFNTLSNTLARRPTVVHLAQRANHSKLFHSGWRAATPTAPAAPSFLSHRAGSIASFATSTGGVPSSRLATAAEAHPAVANAKVDAGEDGLTLFVIPKDGVVVTADVLNSLFETVHQIDPHGFHSEDQVSFVKMNPADLSDTIDNYAALKKFAAYGERRLV